MHQLPFFVYGTLLIGQPNDFYWGDSILKSQSAVLCGMELYAFPDFPMMVETKDLNSCVQGQLIWLEPDRYMGILANVDALEGFDPADHENSLYIRTQLTVRTVDGLEVNAWAYVGRCLLAKGLPLVPDGDWEKHTAQSVDVLSKNYWSRN